MKSPLLTGLLALSLATIAAPSWADGVQFEATLSPYGEWVAVPRFGRVWRPAVTVVGRDFEPYATNGQWVFTDQGWVFESDYAFSWAVYHYGRWYRDPGYGWVWVRGNDWAPAWVDWRSGGGYVGWVPMAPAGIEVVIPAYRPRWAFVETRYLVNRDPWRHRLDERRSTVAYHAAMPVAYDGNRGYGVGPPAGHVASAGVELRPRHIAPPPPGVVQQVVISPAQNRNAGAPPAPGRETAVAAPPSMGTRQQTFNAPPPPGSGTRGPMNAPPPPVGISAGPGGPMAAPPPSIGSSAPPRAPMSAPPSMNAPPSIGSSAPPRGQMSPAPLPSMGGSPPPRAPMSAPPPTMGSSAPSRAPMNAPPPSMGSPPRGYGAPPPSMRGPSAPPMNMPQPAMPPRQMSAPPPAMRGGGNRGPSAPPPPVGPRR